MQDKIIDLSVPGSKSATHRAIICAALAEGVSRVSNALDSVDISRTIEVLGACGASITRREPGSFSIVGLGGPPSNLSGGPLDCFVGESGTSCRLLAPVLAAGRGPFMISGKGRLHQRPLGELVDALRLLGADINYVGAEPGCPPLMINASGLSAEKLPAGEVSISCDLSSQFLSGLLLAAPLAKAGPGGSSLCIRLGGRAPVSWPYVGLTLQSMHYFGVDVRIELLAEDGNWRESAWAEAGRDLPQPGCLRFKVPTRNYRAADMTVEGDWSTASYLLAAGAIGPPPVRVSGLHLDSLQGDRAIVDILRRMGAKITFEGGAVTARPGSLRGIDIDMGAWPDLVPTVLAVAAHASGATVVRNVKHLRLKESDRVMAMHEQLRQVGCSVTELPDGLAVLPPADGIRPPRKSFVFKTYDDHRIAMACSLLGLASGPARSGKRNSGFQVLVDNRECVEKSFPDFWEVWKRIQA